MKERPILFSGPMVRAILEGRKTQTRRVVRDQADVSDVCGGGAEPVVWFPRKLWDEDRPSPYGQPGDRLWVRETWGLHGYGDFTYWMRDSLRGRAEDDLRSVWEVAYAADAESPYDHWRPSIHMPRWASRITLELTAVRVERLQDISEEDARAEGVDAAPFCKAGRPNGLEHVESYEDLWDSLNAERGFGWASNPWVWVLTFARVTP